MIQLSRLPERILDLASDAQPGDPLPTLRAFRMLLLAHLTTELTISFLRWSDSGVVSGVIPLALALVASGIFLLGLFEKTSRFAAPAGALLVFLILARFFPNTANHTFLLFLLLVPVAMFSFQSRDELETCRQSLRWVLALVFFATGLQKVFHGTYFQGEFLAFQIAHSDRFAGLFERLLSGADYDLLRSLGDSAGLLEKSAGLGFRTLPPEPGSGPYQLRGALPLLMSNSVYVVEMLAPLGLLWRRTRTPVTIVVLIFLLFIELGAFEVLFGVLFVSSTLLFLRGNWLPRVLPVVCTVYAYLIGVQAGWFPKWHFN